MTGTFYPQPAVKSPLHGQTIVMFLVFLVDSVYCIFQLQMAFEHDNVFWQKSVQIHNFCKRIAIFLRGEFTPCYPNTPFTPSFLIRSETGFAHTPAFTPEHIIRINDLIRIKLNHQVLMEVVSHGFSLLRVLIASVDANRTRAKVAQI